MNDKFFYDSIDVDHMQKEAKEKGFWWGISTGFIGALLIVGWLVYIL